MCECVFCRIMEGTRPAEFVYRDKEIAAFRDIRPSAPVHVLIVPVEHIESVRSLEGRHAVLAGKMVLVAKELAERLGISDSGYKLVVNVGKGGGQVVFHLHMHLLGGWKAGSHEP